MSAPGLPEAGTSPYKVYAKHAKEPAIAELGEVYAASVDDAVVFAHTLYDERRWEHLFIVPRGSVTTIVEAD